MTDHDYRPAAHYDRVTAAWRLLLGPELHYGVFDGRDGGNESLATATDALTRRMAAAADLRPGLRVLDVGCGTGEPARTIARRHGVEVLGITTSGVGVETARALTEQAGLADRVRFAVADGMVNGLPDDSFDRVWVLESSHLMPERGRLIDECARVLRPGGRVVLCDIVRRRDLGILDIRASLAQFRTLERVFGTARMEPPAEYERLLRAAGLEVERCDDLTAATLPTFTAWRRNAEAHEVEVRQLLGDDGYTDFVAAADILEGFWQDGTLGYALLAAGKP